MSISQPVATKQEILPPPSLSTEDELWKKSTWLMSRSKNGRDLFKRYQTYWLETGFSPASFAVRNDISELIFESFISVRPFSDELAKTYKEYFDKIHPAFRASLMAHTPKERPNGNEESNWKGMAEILIYCAAMREETGKFPSAEKICAHLKNKGTEFHVKYNQVWCVLSSVTHNWDVWTKSVDFSHRSTEAIATSTMSMTKSKNILNPSGRKTKALNQLIRLSRLPMTPVALVDLGKPSVFLPKHLQLNENHVEFLVKIFGSMKFLEQIGNMSLYSYTEDPSVCFWSNVENLNNLC